MLPLIVLTSITSILSGQFMARKGRYMPLVVTGFAVWALGTGLKCTFTRSTKIWVIIVVLLVEGIGVGFTLQPSEYFIVDTCAILTIYSTRCDSV
jgi:MFS family permease